MRLGIIDNGTDCLAELKNLCRASDYEFDVIDPLSADKAIPSNEYDAVVLTGGLWYDDQNEWRQHYGRELELITSSKTPLLGVCLGMHLITLAFGEGVLPLERRIRGSRTIVLTDLGKEELGLPHEISVFENHSKGVMDVPSNFDILARSDDGIEIMRHVELPVAGVQFHPQLSRESDPVFLWQSLITSLVKR